MTPQIPNMLDYLMANGFDATGRTTSDGGTIYDNVLQGRGIVRVVGWLNDGPRFELATLNETSMAEQYRASFSPGTPATVIIAALKGASAHIQGAEVPWKD